MRWGLDKLAVLQHKKYGASNKLRRTRLKTKRIAKRIVKLTAKGLLMLKDFVDSDGDGRHHLSAVKCVETTVSSGCPK